MAGVELWRFPPNPGDEFLDLLVGQEAFERVVEVREFSLRKHRVDLVMTDAMDPDRFGPPESFGDQMMLVDALARDQGPTT